MVIDARERFAQRTATLMFTLSRKEMEERLNNFPPDFVKLVVAHARKMAGALR